MSSWRLHGGIIIILCLLLGCRLGVAIDAGSASSSSASAPPAVQSTTGSTSVYSQTANPALNQQNELPIPAAMALPASGSLAPDASTTRKFYTLTASLREIYDDNVNTTHSDAKTSLETELSPSILVDFPKPGNDFSARYTLNVTYYSVAPNSAGGNGSSGNGNGGGSGGAIQYTHDFVAQYSHAFSDRFNFNAAEEFRYDTQPNLLQSTGTNYQNGPYFTNLFNGTLTAQWTPMFSTTSTFSNTVIRYDNSTVGQLQNSIENTGTQVFSYAVLPKVFASLGGIVDDITYDTALRGYTTYTGFGGGSWQILPSLSMVGRGGATYIQPVQGKDTIAPYASLTLNWSLGARSSLTFDYAHSITPSDQVGADGQTSDRMSANFNYSITPRLSCFLQGILTLATISQELSIQGNSVGYHENTHEVDTGLVFQYNSYLSFDTGVILTGVSSDNVGAEYSRDEAYLGVRGTY